MTTAGRYILGRSGCARPPRSSPPIHSCALAPAAHRAEVDVREARIEPSRSIRGDPTAWWCEWPRKIPRGATRIRGALKNVGHRVSRSTIARILKAHGMAPARRTLWQTFLRAHSGAIAGADFFTTEV